MRKWLLCLTLVVVSTNAMIAQDAPDSRVISNGYWKAMIDRGLAPQTEAPPAETATYLGSKINSRMVLGDDSEDVLTSPGGNTIQSENSIIVDPLDNQSVFNSNNSTDASGNTFYTTSAWKSADGGLTWAGTVNLPGAGSDLGDPATGIDLSGRYYVGHINGFNFGQSVAWSTDGGNNWTNSTIVASGTEDKNHLWVDVVPSSPYEGHVYSAWTAFSSTSGIVVSRSTNSGVNWTTPFYISGAAHGGSHDQGVSLQTGPNGEVYAAWAIYDSWPSNETSIGFAKSLDGGATWLPATRIISNINGIRQDGVGGTPGNIYPVRTNAFPVMTVDISNGANQGRIYIAWVNHGTPGVNTENDRSVWIFHSDDEGATWSTPVKVNTDAFGAGKERFNSWVACDPVTGSLAAIFYDNRNTTGNAYETWVATSIDGGATWEDFRVSDVSFTPAQPPGSYAFGYFGDYLGIAAHGGFVYPVWTDNRSGLPLSYTSPFQLATNIGWVEGTVSSGSTPLEGVTVDFTSGDIQIAGTSDPTGYYLAGAEVDTATGSQNYTLRATKFGYLEYTAPVTLILDDTITHNISMATAAGGTLAVHAETNDGSGIATDVTVLLGGNIVVTGMTDGGTGNFTTPLPVGTYDVTIDPASPYGTETFTGVVITDGNTTNVNALILFVLDPNPTEVRDTLVIGQIHAKTLTLTNTTDEDVPFTISDDNVSLRTWSPPAGAQPPAVPLVREQPPKGTEDLRVGPPQFAGSGGPDEFGYRWIDSDEPGGPTFNWVDISGVGTSLIFGDDQNSGPFNLGFSIEFYGNTYSTINVCSNGWASFTSTATNYFNEPIPTTFDPNNALYGFWDDLYPPGGGTVHYYADAANNQFIIQWTDMPYFSGTGTVTFQIIVKPNKEILYQYLSMTGTVSSSTVGIENADGSIALQVVYDASYIHDGLATKFFLPNATWISENPESGTVPANSSQDITVTFDANGLEVGTTYDANIFVSASHPDVSEDIIVPASLTTQLADSAVLLLSRVVVEFPQTPVNETVRDSVTARNGGATVLDISSITSSNPEFVVTPSSAMLDPLDSIRIYIDYTPTTGEIDTGRVIVLSNSQGTPRSDIILNGEGIGVPQFVVMIDSLQIDIEGGLMDSIMFGMRNTGTAAGDFRARAIVYPPASAGEARSPIILPVQLGAAKSKSGQSGPSGNTGSMRIESPFTGSLSTQNLGGYRGNTQTIVRSEGVGGIISSWPAPSGIVLPWGLGWNFDAGNLLVSDPLGPPIENHYVSETGTLLQSISTSAWHGSWPGDADYDGGYFYQVAVGGTNGIYKLDIDGNVIEFMIDPAGGWSSISQRGLAYDPGEDVFYVGGWNQNIIYKVKGFGSDNPGEVILSYPFINISGLAFHTGSQTLWVADNSATDMIFELDPTTGTILQQFPAPGLTGFVGGGLSIHADGNLWCVNQLELTVYLIETGVPLAAGWLAISPTEGTLGINELITMTANFDATDPEIFENPGNYFGEIQVTAPDSPLADTLSIPVRMFVVPPAGARLIATPTSLDFGDVEINSTETMSTLIKNIGLTTLNVTNITTDNPAFTVDGPTSFSLVTNDTQRVNVSFTGPFPAGPHTANMSFSSNDPMAPVIPLTGESYGVPHFASGTDMLDMDIEGGLLDSLQFFVRNDGTEDGTFSARATVFPPSSASGQSKPIQIPVTIVPLNGNRSVNEGVSSSVAKRSSASKAAKSKSSGNDGGVSYRAPSSSLQGYAEASPSSKGGGSITPPPMLDPFELQFSFDVNAASGAAGNAGAEFDGTYYYTTRWASNLIHKYDMGGILVEEFSISGVSGLRDLTYDGTYMYGGAAGNTIYQMDFVSHTLIGTINSPELVRNIAYDRSADAFWVGNWDTDLVLVNRSGAEVGRISNSGLFGQYGTAYDDWTSGGPYLWLFDQGSGAGLSQFIYQIEIATGLQTGVMYDVAADFPLAAGIAGGLWASEGVVGGKASIGGVLQGVPDEFFVYELADAGAVWLSVAPTSGTIVISDSLLMTARFDATSPEIYENPGDYFGEITVTATDPLADVLTIPVHMFVIPPPGARLTVTPTSLDWGGVEIGSTETMSFRIKNIGAATLDVTNVLIDDPNYAVVPPTSFSVASLDTHRVFVTFTAPEPAGTYDATLSFVSNDPLAPTVPLTAVAEGAAHIAVNPDSFYFSLTTTDTMTASMTLFNSGTGTLEWSINEGFSGLSEAGIKASRERSQRQQELPSSTAKGADNNQPGQPPIDGMGGPDGFGYIWVDSDEPGGPTFEWDDITGLGTSLVMSDDNNQGPFPLGFTFNFYGTDYNAIQVCSNGWVSFTSTTTEYTNTAIPASATPNNAIYGFWDDLNPTLGGTIHYYADAANNRFVVQYTDVPHYDIGGPYTFQIIVKSNGDMLTQYLSINSPDNSCTIGIENADGTIALQTVFDATYVHENLAILFTHDVIPWMSASPLSGTVDPGDSTGVEIRVHPGSIPGGTYEGTFVVSGNTPDVAIVPVRMDLLTGVGPDQVVPTVYSLSQNYPNPFNPETRIKYSLPEQADVFLKIYNMLGQEVASLASGLHEAGYYEVSWKGRNNTGAVVGTGVYFYRFEATGTSGRKFSDLKKMLFLK